MDPFASNEVLVGDPRWETAPYEMAWIYHGSSNPFHMDQDLVRRNQQPNTPMAMPIEPTGPINFADVGMPAQSEFTIQNLELPGGRHIRVLRPPPIEPPYTGPYTSRIIPGPPGSQYNRVQFIDSFGREVPVTIEDRPMIVDENIFRDPPEIDHGYREAARNANRDLADQMAMPAPPRRRNRTIDQIRREMTETMPVVEQPVGVTTRRFDGIERIRQQMIEQADAPTPAPEQGPGPTPPNTWDAQAEHYAGMAETGATQGPGPTTMMTAQDFDEAIRGLVTEESKPVEARPRLTVFDRMPF